jgi:aryl carrier-like protein
MTIDEWISATRPKIQGTWNLHNILPSRMDFFIMLSSVAGVFGNGGQANYCAGNTFQDAFAGFRVAKGEKALSIDLGAVSEEGYLAENSALMERVARLEVFRPNDLADIFALLDYHCQPGINLPPATAQVITGLPIPADILAKGRDMPSIMQRPLFRQTFFMESSDSQTTQTNPNRESVTAAFVNASNEEEGNKIVSEALRHKLSRILGMTPEQLDLNHSLASYGVDSLVGLEIRKWLAKESGADLTVFEILSGATFAQIGVAAAAKSALRPGSWDSNV